MDASAFAKQSVLGKMEEGSTTATGWELGGMVEESNSSYDA